MLFSNIVFFMPNFHLFSILQVIFGLSLLSSSNEDLKNHGMDLLFK